MSDDGRKVIRWAGIAALVAAAVGAATVAVVAEEASALKEVVAVAATRPVQQQGGRGEGALSATSRPWRGGRGGEEAGMRMRVPTEEEWKDVSEFMAKYSPNRLKAIEGQGGGTGRGLRTCGSLHGGTTVI